VVLDRLAEFDQPIDFGLGEHPLVPLVLGDLTFDGFARGLVFDMHQLLRGDRRRLDVARRPVDDVVVGGHGAGDDRLAQSPRRLDDDTRIAGRGVAGEHHAALFGVDHLLDDDRDVDLVVGEPLLVPVVYGPL
jgi:hypothetical protein